MKKRLLFGLFIIIILAVIIYSAWLIISPPKTDEGAEDIGAPDLPSAPQSPPRAGLPQAPPAGDKLDDSAETKYGSYIKKLSDFPVFDFWVVDGSKEVLYITPDGMVFGAKEGNDVEISSRKISSLNKVLPFQNGKKTLVSFGDPNSPQWGVFDSLDEVWIPLPSDIKNASWGENENELIAVVQDASSKNLARVDLTKSPPSFSPLIKNFSFEDTDISFSNPNSLILSDKPSSFYPAGIKIIDLKTLSINTLKNPEKKLWVDYSKNKEFLFISSQTNSVNYFSVIRMPNVDERLPGFFSLPSKCDSSGENVFCFVPGESFLSGETRTERENIPDSYLMKRLFTSDELFVYNFEEGEVNLVFIDAPIAEKMQLDAYHPWIIENSIIVKNRIDDAVYKIDISQYGTQNKQKTTNGNAE